MTEPELREYFSMLATVIESILPAGTSRKGTALFAILVFDNPGVTQYVSNADRTDMIKALKEMVNRLEANEDIPR